MANCDRAENSSWKRTVTTRTATTDITPAHMAMTIGMVLVSQSASTSARAALLDDRSRFEYLPSDEIFNMLAAPAGGRVVDFGAGTGTYAVQLARSRPDLEVIALDEQQEILDLLDAKPAAQRLSNLCAVHTDEITKLNGTADRVLALDVLHEVGDEALRALAALLKPTGTVLVVDWNAGVERPVEPPRDYVYTAAEARERMGRMGLRIEGERMFKYHYSLAARSA